MMSPNFSIAIDGPSGAGKSTIAKLIAAKLNAVYLDTGAMYRAVGLYMRRHDIDVNDAALVERAAAEAKVEIKYVNGAQRVLLCGEDVTERIRKPEISAAASAVSAVPGVRRVLVAAQREIARGQNVVMDGRDTGTKVLPDATLKIYLTADAHERARRRYAELRCLSVTYEQVLDAINERDHADSTRQESPLKKAADAIVIDTTGVAVDQVVERIVTLARARCAPENNG